MKPYRPVHIMFLEFNFKSLIFFFCYRTKIFQFMYYLNPTSPYSSDDYTRTEMISKLSALGCDQRIVQHQTPTQHVFGTAVNVHTTPNSMQKNVKFYHLKPYFHKKNTRWIQIHLAILILSKLTVTIFSQLLLLVLHTIREL